MKLLTAKFMTQVPLPTIEAPIGVEFFTATITHMGHGSIIIFGSKAHRSKCKFVSAILFILALIMPTNLTLINHIYPR